MNTGSTDQSEADSAPNPEILIPPLDHFQIETFERDAYRRFVLTRLTNFVHLRNLPPEEVADDARLHRRIVERAIYSAFRDCVAAGAGDEARQIIDQTAPQAA